MKKAFLLLLGCAIAVCSCQKTPQPETPSKDATLTGTTVNLEPFANSAKKIFVLNEGGLGSNNATLDMIRFTDSQYITGVFKKMNPSVGAGLGDVGNDIAVLNGEVWIVVNNSGIVEVVKAEDETEVAAIAIPTPRSIAFDGQYAYVTSWAGAFATYGADYSITDSANPKGQVYRINLSTKKVEGSVEVGYQPEGIAYYRGKLYVANSGGIASQLPPSYSYDNTVSVIDTGTFTVTQTEEVQVNLKNVYATSDGTIYVTSLGNYYDVHSGIYAFPAFIGSGSSEVKRVGDYVSVSAILDDTVFWMGTESEFDWSATHTYEAWSVRKGVKKPFELTPDAKTLYSLAVIDEHTFLVGDAGDYFNPGSVICYSNGAKLWSVTAGVCPGHFAIWK